MVQGRHGDPVFDWGVMLAMAYRVGITPRAFWHLTFWEYCQCIQGYNDRIRDANERKAHELALLLSAWSTRRVTADELLGRKKNVMGSAEDIRIAALEAQAELDKKNKRWEGRRHGRRSRT